MLSIVVNFFNNSREARNTLYSMTRKYQLGAKDMPYEVIVIDHGSTKPLAAEEIESYGAEFKYRFVPTTAVCPAQAINDACRDAAGDVLMVIIDGAHILSPGIFQRYAEAFTLFSSPFVIVPAMHLGPKIQNVSVREGYNQSAEDKLLDQSAWRENGYRLYTISRDFADQGWGWFGFPYESNCFALRKADYLALGGFDPRFELPGGGLVNLDFYNRAISTPQLHYVIVLGECTFHQFHGGVATNTPAAQHPWARLAEDYARIRGRPFQQVLRKAYFLGALPQEALSISRTSMEHGERLWGQLKA
jgi:hypothetical protein